MSWGEWFNTPLAAAIALGFWMTLAMGLVTWLHWRDVKRHLARMDEEAQTRRMRMESHAQSQPGAKRRMP